MLPLRPRPPALVEMMAAGASAADVAFDQGHPDVIVRSDRGEHSGRNLGNLGSERR